MNTGKYGGPARQWTRSTAIETTWGFRSHWTPTVLGSPLLFPGSACRRTGQDPRGDGGQVLPIGSPATAATRPGTSPSSPYSYDGGTRGPAPQSARAAVDRDRGPHRRDRQAGHPAYCDRHQGNTVMQIVNEAYAVR